MGELYKMILVDDEDEVRGRISSKISNESGFTVVGAAGNGYDAIELIEKHQPHVVLTDIKMPFIDGIELASIIKRDFPTIRVAFITGYDEFDYAREAIELNVKSYLTKPLTQNDISKFLDKLKIELDQEFKEKYNLELLQKRFNESLPVLIDNYFISCLVSTGHNKKDDIKILRNYGVSLDDAKYLLSYIKIERTEEYSDIFEFEKLKLSTRSVISNILERHELSNYNFMFNEGIIFIIKEKGRHFLKDIDNVFFEMVEMAEKYLSVRIDIGVSNLNKEFKSLNIAYEEANKAISYCKFLNAERIIYVNQIEDSEPNIICLNDTEIKKIEFNVKFGSEEELNEQFADLKKNIVKENNSIANFNLFTINMMNILVSFADSIKVDLPEVIGGQILQKMTQFNSIEQVIDWSLNILLKLRERKLSNRVSNSQKLLDNAINIIHEHYDDPTMSMESVNEQLGISVSYMSMLFKKNMNTTFVKYLTKIRMEKARELLEFSTDRIVEIAEKCGYNDVYYFSHCFKKQIGVSPKKYRDEKNNS